MSGSNSLYDRMISNFPGHQRNQSAGQHLIVDRQESGEEEEDVERGGVVPPLVSAGVFPATSPPHHETPREHECRPKRGTRRNQLWTNKGSVLLALFLFTAGSICLILAAYAVIASPNVSWIGWWLVLPGLVTFVPGTYHCFYILCTLCGRPGYSLDNLPTFKR